jgi:methionyl-tRNA formyltransferase
MNSEIDSGAIISQGDISLEGTLDNIFEQIENVGIKLTLEIIKNRFKAKPQNHNEATYFKRRKKADSEITLEELTNKSSEFLYNKIRMLADPYPNAFIKTKDGKKLVILSAKIEE